ncbi:MAG: SIR2 family protein [Candidatus Paceibacterota bacterium]
MPSHDIPAELRDRLSNNALRPFIGSGVSRSVVDASSGQPLFPSWKGFLEATADCLQGAHPKEPKFADRLRLAADFEDETDYWLSSLEFAKRSLGGDSWYGLLKALFDPEQTRAEESSLSLASKVWHLGSNLIITTNFDQSLHWAAHSHCREVRPSSRAELAKILSQSPTTPHVWHLHGSIGAVDELVVTTSDYKRLYKSKAFRASQEAFRQLASRCSLLFVGYSLRDFELLQIFEEHKEIFVDGNPTHYALLSEKDTARIKHEGIPVRPITYQNHNSHLHEILDALISEVPCEKTPLQEAENAGIDAFAANGPRGDHPPVRSDPKSISLNQLFDEYTYPELLANGRQSTTVRDLQNALKRWNTFEQNVCSANGTKRAYCFIQEIDTKSLQGFRRWLLREGHSVTTSMRSAASVVRMLKTAQREGLIDRAPQNTDGPTVRRPSWKPLLQVDQLKSIWRGTQGLDWPSVTEDRKKPVWNTEQYWKAALVMWLTYGLRTQELISLERKYSPILWRDIELPDERQQIDGSSYGWFSYTPQHQRRLKPDPVRLPLTKPAYQALLKLRPQNPAPSLRVFNAPLSSTTFRKSMRILAEVACLPDAGGKLPTLIRDTAIQNLDFHYVGISDHVTGKAPHRSPATRIRRPGGRTIALAQAFLDCYATFDTYDELFEEVNDQYEA